jgi:CHASE1-domain containing sensor protein
MSARDPDITRHEGSTMRRRLLAWLVMCNPASVAVGIGLVLSLAGAYAVSQWEERVTRVEFEGVAETQSIIMQNGMNEYISRLVALRTLFESANEEVTRSEFEAFAGRLFERHPGILRVAWLPRVNRKERAEYEAAAITDGISGYRIKSLNADGSITTAPQNDEYYPVSFPPSRRPRWSMVWIMRRPPNGGRRSNARATTT